MTPIYAHELAQYRKDSARSLASRWLRKWEALNRVKPTQLIQVLAAVVMPLSGLTVVFA